MNNLTLEDITGKGLIFPLELTPKGSVVVRGGFDLIKSSIKQIVVWLVGTRYFLGEYGTTIMGSLEEPNDVISQGMIEFNLYDKLPMWDKRFNIQDVTTIQPKDGTLNISITIALKNTEIQETLTFSFNNGILY